MNFNYRLFRHNSPHQFSSHQDLHEEYKKNDPLYQNGTLVHEFEENYFRMKKEIDAHHASYLLGLISYDRAPQRWTDLPKEIKLKRKLGLKLPRRVRAPTNAAYLRILKAMPKVPAGTQVDNCKFPSPIHDQQACGCCWAYSCVQVLQHQFFKFKNQKVEFSVQQLVDCDSSNDACEGGWPSEC
jgi:hypothetical protein